MEGRPVPPMFLRFRSSKGFILTTACFGIFTHLFFYGMLVAVLPTALRDRAHVPPEDVQRWNSFLLAIYSFATLSVSPISGWFCNLGKTRRLPYLVSLLMLTGATIFLSLGTTPHLWALGRLLQGWSSGFLWVASLAIISDSVPADQLAQAMGIVGIPWSFGPIVGPLAGGLLYSAYGWWAVFGTMLGMLVLDGTSRMFMIEVGEAKKWLDVGADEDETSPLLDGSGEPLAPPAAAAPTTAVGVAATTAAEMDTEPPTSYNPPSHWPPHTIRGYPVPTVLRLLLHPRMANVVLGSVLHATIAMSFDSTLPLVVEALFGWTERGQGLIFIAVIMPSLLQPYFGAATDALRQGPRLMSAGGCLVAVPAFLAMRAVTDNTLAHQLALSALLVVVGAGMAMAMPALLSETASATTTLGTHDRLRDESDEAAAAAGGTPRGGTVRGAREESRNLVATGWSLLSAASSMGTMLGALFAGLLRDTYGWDFTLVALALLAAGTAAFLAVYIGGWVGDVIEKGGMFARVPRKRGEDESAAVVA